MKEYFNKFTFEKHASLPYSEASLNFLSKRDLSALIFENGEGKRIAPYISLDGHRIFFFSYNYFYVNSKDFSENLEIFRSLNKGRMPENKIDDLQIDLT